MSSEFSASGREYDANNLAVQVRNTFDVMLNGSDQRVLVDMSTLEDHQAMSEANVRMPIYRPFGEDDLGMLPRITLTCSGETYELYEETAGGYFSRIVLDMYGDALVDCNIHEDRGSAERDARADILASTVVKSKVVMDTDDLIDDDNGEGDLCDHFDDPTAAPYAPDLPGPTWEENPQYNRVAVLFDRLNGFKDCDDVMRDLDEVRQLTRDALRSPSEADFRRLLDEQ